MKTGLLSMFSTLPIFNQLGAAEQDLLAELGTSREFQKGENIVLYGDTWSYLMLVVDGQVEAIKESAEGRRLQVASFEPGDVFWGLSFFHDDAPMPVTLEVRQPSRVILWPRDRLLPVILQNPRMGWELCRLMSARMLRASAMVEELAFQPVAGRLANFLMEQSPELMEGPIARSLTLDDIAARIGSTREVVCRFLQRFADQGLIEITRSEFVIVDRKQLSDLAQQVKG